MCHITHAALAVPASTLCLQGTVLATVGHINGFILPDLYKDYRKFEGQPHASLSPEDKEKKSHIVTAIKNWAVRTVQPSA